ncbi:MAG: putative zinc-binding metallopeptidase [Steroidobacteraceae bacterium]|nr:putative zinc-binding metallopeptidase [Steroidobacteraceae bacterium]MCC7199898.1 putative zinc-binding metallopeptidase [Gammaproteobacteria bacterium]
MSITGSSIEPQVERLYAELAERGIKLRPHCWVSLEWFSPDGVPGIAVPFYLLHPRLRRLERRMMREVDGGNEKWAMRILRHEAGHAVDTAYRLRRRRAYRDTFGSPSVPYPHEYRPRPGSRRFVQHLGLWYAQSHPTEDFAETFAVWLRPLSPWRSHYAGWPALAKLECVDDLMHDLRGVPAVVRSRAHIEPLVADRHTLAEHYAARIAWYHRDSRSPRRDRLIARALTTEATPGHRTAAQLLRRHKPRLRREVAANLGASEYEVHQVLRWLSLRCVTRGLYLRGDQRSAARRLERLVTALLADFHRARGPRVAV